MSPPCRIALSAFLVAVASVSATAFAQPVQSQVSSCGEFQTIRSFGETEFEFRHKNFQHCSEMVPAGLTLVDAVASANGNGGKNAESYTVTCQCADALCVQGLCGR